MLKKEIKLSDMKETHQKGGYLLSMSKKPSLKKKCKLNIKLRTRQPYNKSEEYSRQVEEKKP